MSSAWSHLDLASPSQVADALHAGARANLEARCRRGSIDVIEPPGKLIATGDLHDNPFHLARIVELANLETDTPSHVTLHELIHGESLQNGLDLSYRVLVKAAALKVMRPEHVHVLLANHELAQIVGAGVMKGGVNCVKAFTGGLEYVFGEEATTVSAAIDAFIRSMPLALRCTTSGGTRLMCAHSIPEADTLDRFDYTIFGRPLRDEDYQPRAGSAHFLTWGRDHSESHLKTLAHLWGVDLFILGHELAETGIEIRTPNVVIINSDHPHGKVVEIDLAHEIRGESVLRSSISLATDSW